MIYGTADDLVVQAEVRRVRAAPPPPWTPVVIGSCRRCTSESLCEGGLCVDCREDIRWSAVNRAFCALIHRDTR